MPRYDLSISGIQEAQDLNLRLIEAFEPGGEVGEIVKDMTIEAHRFLVTHTHVDTGAYKASHRMELTDVRGTITPDPKATNPKTGDRVKDYAEIEEGRGGEHAVYELTRIKAGDRIAELGVRAILRIV